jgi:hypothetical protein
LKQKTVIKNWYTYLELIRKRPSVYGIQKVEDIFMLHLGYYEAIGKSNAVDEDFEHFSTGFMDFVIADYNAPAHCSWCTAIRLYSASDIASVELFFEELAKFKSGESEFDRIKYREENKIFCCQQMADRVEESVNSDGAIKYNNADVIINKWGNGTYGIPIHDGGTSVIQINHCPWCGSKL